MTRANSWDAARLNRMGDGVGLVSFWFAMRCPHHARYIVFTVDARLLQSKSRMQECRTSRSVGTPSEK